MQKIKYVSLALILMILSLFPGWAALSPADVRMIGDTDSNGVVSIVDALAVARVYVGFDAPPGFNSNTADVNCDGNIDILDALSIARFYVGLEQSFPADEVYAGYQLTLDRQRFKWEQKYIKHYVYFYLHYDPVSGRETSYLVEVDDNVILAVTAESTQTALPADRFTEFVTINQLLELFQVAINRKWLSAAPGEDPMIPRGDLQLDVLYVWSYYPSPTPTPPPTPNPFVTPSPLPALPPLSLYFPYKFKSYWLTMF